MQLCDLFSKPNFEDLMNCFFGLTDTDIKVMKFCSNWKKCSELTKKLGVNQSTVQRSLKRLLSVELMVKRKKSATRGYFFEYKSVPKTSLKKVLDKKLVSRMKELRVVIHKY